jgi:GNAT superfamily N-acetyltransferase
MTTTPVPTVVTYLEMKKAPTRLPPQPVGSPLALMRVEPMPLHFYRYLYSTIGRDYYWVERLGIDDAELAGKIAGEGVEISVLYGNGAPAGYFELDFSEMPGVSLVYFGLFKDWIGRGIGAWLLGCAISEAFSRSANLLKVNTCTFDHPSALAFYQRMGFEPVGQENRVLNVPSNLLKAANLPQ